MDRVANIPAWLWKLALMAVAAIWGSTFVVTKGVLDVVPPAWMLFLRFGFATLILCVVFAPTLRAHLDADHLRKGTVLGIFSGVAMLAQLVGLSATTPGKNAFLTAIYCVLVPFINWIVANRRPLGAHVIAALLAIVGVGFISLGDGMSLALSWGDAVTLGSSLFFALQIVYVARYSADCDVIVLTIVQSAVTALVGLVWALAFEQAPDFGSLDPGFWAALAYIVIMASCVCIVLQNVAQSIVEPATAALLMSLECVFAVIFSVIFYHEALTASIVTGFALIFIAILVSEVLPLLLERRRQSC